MTVSLEAVEKRFGERSVILPTSLELADGARLALVGPSGSGKSTLLRMVVGLVVPDSGHVRVGGVEVNPQTARAVRRRIGYVIQDGGLFPHLTAADNVALVAKLDGWPAERRHARIAELAKLARLPETHLARFPRELSGGERQRVGLMRALMLDPEVLLLDEPLGALDPIVRAKLQTDLVAAFDALGKSVLLVTHDMAEAAMLGQEIAVVREGAIVQRGTMRELVDTPAHPFVAELVGIQRASFAALGAGA